MDSSFEELNYDSLAHFLEEHENILKMDKMNLLRKENVNSNFPVISHATVSDIKVQHKIERTTLQSKGPYNKTKDNMVKGASGGYVLLNSREKEKDKLINLLSVPKTRHASSDIKERNSRDSTSKSKCVGIVDAREKEKDRLAAIFASTGCELSKASNYQISKNLNCGISFNKSPQSKPLTSSEDVITNNYGNLIPEVLISEYEDGGNNLKKTNRNTITERDSRMVRIGEFSPLNPEHLAKAAEPMLGIGEYDQRRKSFNEQRNLEYNQYLQQKSQKSPPNARQHNQHLKDVGTQTVWHESKECTEDADHSLWGFNDIHSDKPRSHCVSPCSPRRLSPVTKCCQEMGERELKEQLYREELRKQIEEKNRMKEEIRKKEEEEEAKLEAKIRRDQEKVRRQYEEERLQRLELAIRKRENDNLLRQKLALEQQKVQEENQTKRKSILKKKSSPPKDTSFSTLLRSRAERRNPPLSQSLPTTARASKGLTDIHEIVRQPLKELDDIRSKEFQHKPTIEITVRPINQASALNQPSTRHHVPLATAHIDNVKSVDILVQEGLSKPPVKKTTPEQQAEEDAASLLSRNIREQVAEVENMMREPLLTESYRLLPPMSPPLLYATVPPVVPSAHSRSPPVPASRRNHPRTNTDLLEDKWKVPQMDKPHMPADADMHAKHNRHVLTQLGAFRRQLQQERMRLRQQHGADDRP